MEKIPLVKEKENYIIISGFLLDFLQVKFSLWFLPSVPNGFNSLGNCRGSILYPEDFHQSHCCMHIKEGYSTACVNYGSYKHLYSNLNFHCKSKVNTTLCITTL